MTDVNGIVGNTQQAAVEATTARQATKVAWQDSLITHIVIGLTLLAVGYIILYNLEWNFFSKILAGAGLIFLAGKLAGVKSKLTWYWPGIFKGIGWGIILLTVLQSGFIQLVGTGVNAIEEEAAKAAGVVIPPKILSPEEQAARVAKAKQEAELQVIAAAAQAAADEEARRIRAIPDVQACKAGRWASQYPKCELVVFTNSEQSFQREATSDQFCVYYTNSDAVSQEVLQPGLFRYEPATTGRVEFEIFDLPLGETFNGFTCG